MDDMHASWGFYAKDGGFDQLEQSNVCILTITKILIVMLIVKHTMILSFSFMSDPFNFLRQTLPDVLPLEE